MKKWSVLVLLLGACNFKSSMTSGSSQTTPSSSMPSSSSTPSSVSSASGKIAMLDLTGKTPAEAEAALKAAGFEGQVAVERTSIACEDNATPPEGKIDCQSPDAGESMYRNREVRVHVYEKTKLDGVITGTQLDKLKGMKLVEAKAYLAQLGYKGKINVRETPSYYSKCKPETVCDYRDDGQDRAGMDLYFNKSSVDISMPD